MTALVDRLRWSAASTEVAEKFAPYGTMLDEAADEIERQQQVIANMMIDAHVSADEIERLRAQIVASENLCLAAAYEIDRLRAALKEMIFGYSEDTPAVRQARAALEPKP